MAKITMGQKDKGKTHHLQPFTDTNMYVVRIQIRIEIQIQMIGVSRIQITTKKNNRFG